VKGVWRPGDRAASRYHYVPIEVPRGGFEVTLEYDRGSAVLDLGLFTAGGEFRGYSGGARGKFTITPEWATPGYLPGELDDATVFLGLHRVPPNGLEWSISVGPPGAPEPSMLVPVTTRPPRRTDLPDVDGMRWLAGDLHAHTVHSDGTLTIDALAALAVSEGLDFLAVTDHNTISHHPHLTAAGRRHGITLLPGQEVTTDRGHANAFGDLGWIDFRRPAAEWATEGGLLSINHPLAADCAWLHRLDTRPPLAEIWHSAWWDRTWGAPLAWLLAWAPGTIPIGGSDFHDPSQGTRLGHPTTWVLAASPASPDILDAMATGRTAVSESPGGPLLLRIGPEIHAIGADGLLLADFTGRRRLVHGDHWTTTVVDGPHWLEDDRAQVMALTA